MTSGRSLPLLAISVIAACGAFDSTPDSRPTAASNDAGAREDGGGGGGADAGSGCPVIHVAQAGSDSSLGCTPRTPKATIGGALAYLKTLGIARHEIHVCRGTYKESLTIDLPVTLRGGYECVSFERTASFGFGKLEAGRATGFDRVNRTQIEAAGAEPTVTFAGATVTPSVVFEGFDVLGPNSGQSMAVVVRENAAPTITHNELTGGAGKTDLIVASAGIGIFKAGSPRIIKNRINGGRGVGFKNGSAGIWSEDIGADTTIQDNEIDGGSGTADVGATSVLGMHIATGALASPEAIVRNAIHWSGVAPKSSMHSGIGISIIAASAAITDNELRGGSQKCIQGLCGSDGVFGSPKPPTTFARNRVYPGDEMPGGAPSLTVIALNISGGDGMIIQDNLLDSGTGNVAYGLTLGTKGGGHKVLNNTVHLSGTRARVGIGLATANNEIRRNIFTATSAGGTTHTAVQIDSCPRPTAVHENAFVGFQLLLATANCAVEGTVEDVVTLEQTLNQAVGAGTAAGNVRIASFCNGLEGPRCEARPSCYTSCDTDVFSPWTKETSGKAELFGVGWKVRPELCLLKTMGALATGTCN